jgi:hypothetical protein
MLPYGEALISLSNALSALCLNTSGLARVQQSRILQVYVHLFTSRKCVQSCGWLFGWSVAMLAVIDSLRCVVHRSTYVDQWLLLSRISNSLPALLHAASCFILHIEVDD